MDDRDLQIVKSYGRGIGYQKKNDDNQYPEVRNLPRADRRQVLVPHLYVRERDLHFREGDQRMKLTVKYEDYKQFKSDTVIKYGDIEDPNKTQPPPSTPPTTPKKP